MQGDKHMATYDHKQVLTDYDKGKITPEMAVGHSLQHIDQLYAAQIAARTEWRTEIAALEKRVNIQQAVIDRLTVFREKVLAQQKKRNSPSQPKPDQP
jgi:hypothetical protein